MAATSASVPVGMPLDDLDIHGVMSRLPHRYPMLLIDRVIGMEAYLRAVGIKQLTINEHFFQGHFPSDPIVPGVFLIESMAQTAATLVISSMGPDCYGNPVYFMGVNEARFRRPVRPGDELRLEVEIQRSRLSVYRFGGVARVRGEVAAEATFSAKMMLDR